MDMGWESRKGRRYYYRTEWCGGMRRNVYYGADPKATRLLGMMSDRNKREQKPSASSLAPVTS